MVPKFANPHSLSQDMERTTRSEIAEWTGVASVICDEDSRSLKRDLDDMLRDTWGDALAETSRPPRAKKHRKASRDNEDGQLVFRLISNMKHPQHISLDPKMPTRYLTESREPDCEDDEVQAEVRRIRALSVAVDFRSLGQTTVSTPQVKPKSVKALLTNTPSARSLPPFLVAEEDRRIKGRPQASESPALSPHEPRLSCAVLSVITVPESQGKKRRRKPMKVKPPSGYWRPSPDVRGKSMGYALGYPSSWAPKRLYVRDTMKRGVEST